MSATQYYGTGRRKTSTARVFITQGTGKISINDRTIEEYFGRPVARMVVMQPLELVDMVGKFDVTVTVTGGGSFGQAGAKPCVLICVKPVTLPVTLVKLNVRKWACVKHVRDHNTPNVNCHLDGFIFHHLMIIKNAQDFSGLGVFLWLKFYAYNPLY
jgi:hypothetical protein